MRQGLCALHAETCSSEAKQPTRTIGARKLEAMKGKEFVIEIRSEADFLAELGAEIRRVEAGRKGEEPTERVFFESIDAANRLLTPKRVELLQVLHKEGPMNTHELSKRLGRDYKNTRLDVLMLHEVGLVTRDGRQLAAPWGKIRILSPDLPDSHNSGMETCLKYLRCNYFVHTGIPSSDVLTVREGYPSVHRFSEPIQLHPPLWLITEDSHISKFYGQFKGKFIARDRNAKIISFGNDPSYVQARAERKGFTKGFTSDGFTLSFYPMQDPNDNELLRIANGQFRRCLKQLSRDYGLLANYVTKTIAEMLDAGDNERKEMLLKLREYIAGLTPAGRQKGTKAGRERKNANHKSIRQYFQGIQKPGKSIDDLIKETQEKKPGVLLKNPRKYKDIPTKDIPSKAYYSADYLKKNILIKLFD